jgi:hypothetical protein
VEGVKRTVGSLDSTNMKGNELLSTEKRWSGKDGSNRAPTWKWSFSGVGLIRVLGELIN